MNKAFAQQLSAYEQYHQQKNTRISHYIGIPLVLFALMIFLGWIHLSVPNLFSINFSWIGLILLLIYYFKLDALLAAGAGVILIFMTLLSQIISQPIITLGGFIIFLLIFIIGILALWMGHRHENQKQVLINHLPLVLIGPIYLFAKLMFALGYRKDLQEELKKNNIEKNN